MRLAKNATPQMISNNVQFDGMDMSMRAAHVSPVILTVKAEPARLRMIVSPAVKDFIWRKLLTDHLDVNVIGMQKPKITITKW